MDAVALMFPGQGSQFPGMGTDLLRENSRAREILEQADDILGYSLSRIMAAEDGRELGRTVHTQPAIFVHSIALLEVLREHCDISPVVGGGHSLGEYSALCAAGMLDFATALDIIRVRARGMEEAQPPGTCGMAALIGMDREEALGIVESVRGEDVLDAANFNAPDQTVVSGHLSAVNRAMEAAKGLRRAKAVLLPVSSAFHTRLMEPAKHALRRRLDGVVLGNAKFPVVANLTGLTYSGGDDGHHLMIDQVVRPVLWQECVRTMQETGAGLFLEIGPGKVLTGLLRRIGRSVPGVSISDMEGIRSFKGSRV